MQHEVFLCQKELTVEKLAGIMTKLYFFLCNKGWHMCLKKFWRQCKISISKFVFWLCSECHPLLHKKKHNFVLMQLSDFFNRQYLLIQKDFVLLSLLALFRSKSSNMTVIFQALESFYHHITMFWFIISMKKYEQKCPFKNRSDLRGYRSVLFWQRIEYFLILDKLTNISVLL